jgi:EAL domain-containing protein (putative c-di-GMP-specific phosphodiesterase class I)
VNQAKSWLESGLSPVCVTVNLSARQLHDPGLIRTVSGVLKETGVPAGCLFFEIPESTVMSDIDRTAVRLRELADMGIHISIDDFGTGYSSLNHLERLPVERLKIDKSFIRRVPADPDNRAIVRSVTSLAHNMRMKVVAEGVETEDQFRFVRATGCDEMQGYLFSKPLPAEDFAVLLAKR